MVVLIAGATHTGKTALAQKLLEKYRYPYLSIDHLKMGLIRSGQTTLTPYEDALLLPFLWNIVKEIVKTAIENEQNLIVEGLYIPFDWQTHFDETYLKHIRCLFLAMSKEYIKKKYSDILEWENCIEKRLPQNHPEKQDLIKENEIVLQECKKHSCPCFLIDKQYPEPEEIFDILML